jgi:Protein of unknown function (DUF2934)
MRKTLLIRYVCEAYSFSSQVHAPPSAATPPTIVLAKREPLTEEVMVMAKSAQRKTDDPVAVASDRAAKALIDAATDISEHDIARRAYVLYLTRGSKPGHDVEDWLQAERELRSRSGAIAV